MRLWKKPTNAADAPMSSTELAAARATLDMAPAQLADEVNVTLYELEAMEAGRKPVPESVAIGVRFRLVGHEHARIMAMCPVPECAEAQRRQPDLDAAVERMSAVARAGGRAFDDALEELDALNAEMDAHRSGCPTCTARRDWAEAHLPPLPAISGHWLFRAIDGLEWLGARLPAFVRPPAGIAGKGRRSGMLIALGLLAVGVVRLLVASVVALVRGEVPPVLPILGGMLLVGLPMLAIGYLAGWIVDATHRHRHQLLGYVLRGLLIPPILFAGVGAIIAADDGGRPGVVLLVAAATAVVGAVAGAVFWVVDKWRDRLPRRARS